MKCEFYDFYTGKESCPISAAHLIICPNLPSLGRDITSQTVSQALLS